MSSLLQEATAALGKSKGELEAVMENHGKMLDGARKVTKFSALVFFVKRLFATRVIKRRGIRHEPLRDAGRCQGPPVFKC